jgi:hypothetical protein
MGFGVCPRCGGYWTSVGDYVNYCVCKDDQPKPPASPPRVLCPAGTRGCGQIAAGAGRWWYCSAECRALNKERP